MTYKTNIVIFAFAAILMAMPLTNSNVFGDGSADLDNVCGFTTTNPFGFGDFAKGATVTEVNVLFPAVTDTTGSARFTVSATDWIGDGDRSEGTITLVGVLDLETVEIGGITYTAEDDGAALAATEFAVEGDDLADAQSLADQVRANDATLRTSTSGTNVVTVQAETRGSGGDTKTLVETVANAGTVVSGATLASGGANAIKHMEAEVTKFDITSDGTASTGTAYASKQAFNVATVNKEMIGGTDPSNSLDISLEITGVGTVINLPYDGPLTQTLTFTVTCDGT